MPVRSILLQGGSDAENGDYTRLRNAADAPGRHLGTWSTLRDARAGDEAWFYVGAPHSAIVAVGIALGNATPGDEWPFQMDVGDVRWLSPPVLLTELRAALPGWGWVKGARGRAYLPDNVGAYLRHRMAIEVGTIVPNGPSDQDPPAVSTEPTSHLDEFQRSTEHRWAEPYLGSAGSAAGLALGFVLAGVKTRVHAVRCSSPATSSRAVVDEQIRLTAAHLRRLDPSVAASLERDAAARLEIDGAELGAGYAIATVRGAQAIQDFASAGIPLEATYGAKAAAAIRARAPAWRGRRVDFWLGSDAAWLAGARPTATTP